VFSVARVVGYDDILVFSLPLGFMVADSHTILAFPPSSRTLSAYLLGTLEFDESIALQRRLVYDIGGDRTNGAVVFCDHPPGVTIGREGSRLHIRPNFEALTESFRPYVYAISANRTSPPVQWVSRGGGTMLHLPGQVACYPVLPLDMLGLSVARYLEELQNIALALLQSYNIIGVIDPDRPGIRVNGRRVVHIGIAIRERISCFGLVVNVNPKLDLFHAVRCDGDPTPMTSLQRESPQRMRVQAIRQRMLELIAGRLGFERVSIFHNHPSTQSRSKRYAAAPRA
jgi:lipoyl(octanoyl) transferase